jgi:RNA polymerase sigma-70 factor (ECF subfamily)
MNEGNRHRPQEPVGPSEFASTRWSIVLAAAGGSSPDSREALERLCRSYWYPLYAYARRRVQDVQEAEDLIQEFFARLLDKNLIAVADPERGRFRSFLLASLRNFHADAWDKTRTQKRGGDRSILSLDFETAETQYNRLEPADEQTPEHSYDRQWAITLLDHVMERLHDEFARAGKLTQFNQLAGFLGGRDPDRSYAMAARELGISEGAAMVAAHRLRRRFRDLLRAEIAQTVTNSDEIDAEISSLFASLRR